MLSSISSCREGRLKSRVGTASRGRRAAFTRRSIQESKDIYGQDWHVSDRLKELNAVCAPGSNIQMGAIRSVFHPNGSHSSAQTWMNRLWQSPVATVYPSTAAVMAHFHNGRKVGIGIPSIVIPTTSGLGSGFNTTAGANVPAAFNLIRNAKQALNIPDMVAAPVDAKRFAARNALTDVFDKSMLNKLPDAEAKAWEAARQQAYEVTKSGQNAAFDLNDVTPLPGGPGALDQVMLGLLQAQQLALAGVPYIGLGINNNDTHGNSENQINTVYMTRNIRDMISIPLAQMCQNLAKGKNADGTPLRTLICCYGEFGRTPCLWTDDTKTQVRLGSGGFFDGRDHWSGGFSIGMIAINQPKEFKFTAVGDTGPNGMWTPTLNQWNSVYGKKGGTEEYKPLVDGCTPSAFGGFLYRACGFPVGTDPSTQK